MAIKRWNCLEARMAKDNILKQAVTNEFENLLTKNYARKVNSGELIESNPRIWYLPVFPVMNPNKPGKVRLVFDAAAVSNGVSLNSVLVKGPDQMPSLIGILLRFRQRKIGIVGDIKEMFMQIGIKKEDMFSQLFLYKRNGHLETFVLQTMTFGATCSPACAQFVKNENAKLFQNSYPEAVNSIIKNHYVDDMLDSVDSDEEAIKLVNDVKYVHSHAGFEIRKFKSNSIVVMKEIGEDINEEFNLQLNKDDQTDKVLGMFWCRKGDYFTYSLRFNKGNELIMNGSRKPTMREILRVLMSLYDPLGLLTHFTTYLKVLMQDVWRSKVNWDDIVEIEHYERWLSWINELSKVNHIKILRWYIDKYNGWKNVEAQLHIFCDASQDCSVGVAYLRLRYNEDVNCCIIMAKSKVSPLKVLTTPKLELVAALLGARISSSILESLTIPISRTTFWADSKTVLLWLRSDAKKIRGQFEKFRVSEIQKTTAISNWRYVPTKHNVADDATKWSKLKLNSDDRWFRAPAFLYKDEKNWPEDITVNKTVDRNLLHIIRS